MCGDTALGCIGQLLKLQADDGKSGLAMTSCGMPWDQFLRLQHRHMTIKNISITNIPITIIAIPKPGREVVEDDDVQQQQQLLLQLSQEYQSMQVPYRLQQFQQQFWEMQQFDILLPTTYLLLYNGYYKIQAYLLMQQLCQLNYSIYQHIQKAQVKKQKLIKRY